MQQRMSPYQFVVPTVSQREFLARYQEKVLEVLGSLKLAEQRAIKSFALN
jgi:hypothetical protein